MQVVHAGNFVDKFTGVVDKINHHLPRFLLARETIALSAYDISGTLSGADAKLKERTDEVARLNASAHSEKYRLSSLKSSVIVVEHSLVFIRSSPGIDFYCPSRTSSRQYHGHRLTNLHPEGIQVLMWLGSLASNRNRASLPVKGVPCKERTEHPVKNCKLGILSFAHLPLSALNFHNIHATSANAVRDHRANAPPTIRLNTRSTGPHEGIPIIHTAPSAENAPDESRQITESPKTLLSSTPNVSKILSVLFIFTSPFAGCPRRVWSSCIPRNASGGRLGTSPATIRRTSRPSASR